MARYPIGKYDFKTIREGGYVYVDKTEYIGKLLEGANYYFLARPRRFGKSMFVSTLEYFFRGERELFRGLAIESNEKCDWKEYPVIRIDFAPKKYVAEGALEEFLHSQLEELEFKYDIQSKVKTDFKGRFYNVIKKANSKTGLPVVVLVDEYEKPVVDNIDNEKLMHDNRETLRGFYSVLKALDGMLKFVFLTGVTKFGQMNVFSGLNNLRDISLNDNYAAICGITEQELLDNFHEGIGNIAAAEGIDFDEAIQLLKQNYDGYHFSGNSPDIYNPFSVVNALEDKEIDEYWARTGTPTILVKVLTQYGYEIFDLEGIEAPKSILMGIDSQFDNPVSLFYQTGYLTIKSYERRFQLYTLGYPNREVELAFFNYILPTYAGKTETQTNGAILNLARYLRDGNPEEAMRLLESFTAGISYDLIPEIEKERHFQTVLSLIFKLLLPYTDEVQVELRNSDGRPDIVVKTEKYIYIFELKINSTPEVAIRQMEEKRYGLPFEADPRKVFLIGINFSTEKKRIEGVDIATI